jgi:hypothetical protein
MHRFAFLLPLLLVAASQDDRDQDHSRLLPLESRNQWTYEVSGGGTARMKVLRKKKYKGETYWIVQLQMKGSKETKHLRSDASGIKQHFYQLQSGSEILRIPTEDPVYEMVFPPTEGRTWELRLRDRDNNDVRRIHRILAEKKIEVPAGAFSCLGVELKILTNGKTTETTTTWYAIDVGIVEIVRRAFDDSGKQLRETALRLKSHKVKMPKPRAAEKPPDPEELKAETRSRLQAILDMAVEEEDHETAQLIANLMIGTLGADEAWARIERDAIEQIRQGTRSPSVSSGLKKAISAAEKALGKPYRLLGQSAKEIETELKGFLFGHLSDHVGALKAYNEFRRRARLDPVTWDWEISRGALYHSRYLANTGYANAREAMDLHKEDKKSPYYTPEGARAGMGGVVASGMLTRSISEWMASFYHRVLLLRPALRRIGTGMWSEGIDLTTPSVIDVSSGTEGSTGSEPVAFPADRTTGIGTRFTQYGELPKPVPGTDEKGLGYPVTLTFFHGTPREVEAVLRQGEKEVSCFVSTADRPTNPKAPSPTTICLMPKKPLAARKKYTVRIRCTIAGKAFSKEWSFTTR